MSTYLSSAATSAAIQPIHHLLGIQAFTRRITYSEVFKRVEDQLTDELEAKGKSLKRVANFRTARNGWMKQLSLTEESPVGNEFGSEFTSCLEQYTIALGTEGKTVQTIADRRSMLGVYREAWVEILQATTVGVLEGDFTQALNNLIEWSGHQFQALAREIGVNQWTFFDWRKGVCLPSRRFLPTVHRIEDIFGLPCGTLVSKLPSVLYGDTGKMRTGLTGYRKHLSRVKQIPYLLKEFPPPLQAEWDRLFLFHTDAAWLRTQGMKRNSKWRVREHDNCCPTAEIVRSMISEFLGYLSLAVNENDTHSGGKGFKPGELTLALLSHSELVYSFLQFKKERTYLKQYNTATYNFLAQCQKLLRPQTGFLWQSPSMGSRLPEPVTKARWHKWCEHHRSIIKSTVDDLLSDDEIKKTRDPFEPIRAIIVNNQHPLGSLFELADLYERDAPPRQAAPRTKAVHFQYLFLIKFATLIPLRAFNFSVMTWRPDNTGNLYQKPCGSWWVRFEPSYLKNHKGASKNTPFDVPLHESLRPYVEQFLFVHRPHLLGASECDYVFRPGRSHRATRAKRVNERVHLSHLSIPIFRITQRYIPNCPGFGMHAFRHLAATEYIKNNPAGYAVAAAVLHDREETIKKNYDWVLPADKFGFWNEYVGILLKNREEEEAFDSAGVKA